MSTFSAKGTDIDIEAIMANIRKKIEEKRKGFYTEEEVREISDMKLDAILDASEFNSDFVSAFRARDKEWNYAFTSETIYASSRSGGGGIIQSLRRLLNPVLKLFFNPNPMISALTRQADLNRYYVLLLHNMVTEVTRLNLEVTNLKGRLRTLGIRVDFQSKREKTFEQLVTSSDSKDSSTSDSRRRGRGVGRRPTRRRRGGKPMGNRSDSGNSRDSGGSSGGGGSK